MKRQTKPSVAVADVLAWQPCADYDERCIRALFGRRRRLTGEQILDLDIPVEDRMWAVLRAPFLSECDIRLYAADVAEHVLCHYESRYPGDGRPRAAIDAARRFARGEIGDAALAAAWDAALAAARDAAWAAAWAAARDAARAAAWAAARDAARDAAWDAALDAALAAAWDAAWDAARDAAWDAAWDAEREWQVVRCREYLRGEVSP